MGYKGIETKEMKRAILDFPFGDLDSFLEQRYDPTHKEAKGHLAFLGQHDPVLFEAMEGWKREHNEAWKLRANPSVAFAGAMLCYVHLKEKAEGVGQMLPSFTALGKKPEHNIHSPDDQKRVGKEMEVHDPGLAQVLGKIVFILRAFEWQAKPGNNDPVDPCGAFVMEGALKCYAAFRNLAAQS